MVAFKRQLDFLVRPCEPSAFLLGQLTLTVVEEMIERLRRITPVTLKDAKKRVDIFTLCSKVALLFCAGRT